jgi:hypothetical protein
MPDLTVEHLDKHRLLDAWPILEMASAERVPLWWEHEAGELLRRGGGVLVVRASDGFIHGLASYEPVDGPSGRRLLAVDRLTTFELSLKQHVRRALLHSLDLLAVALGCADVVLPLPAGRGRWPRGETQAADLSARPAVSYVRAGEAPIERTDRHRAHDNP